MKYTDSIFAIYIYIYIYIFIFIYIFDNLACEKKLEINILAAYLLLVSSTY